MPPLYGQSFTTKLHYTSMWQADFTVSYFCYRVLLTSMLYFLYRADFRSDEIRHPVIFGDGTPGIIFSNDHWERYVHTEDEQTVLTPKYLNHIQRNAKIIAILRNPVTMVFSSYKFFNHYVPSSVMSVDHFHMCVLEAIESLQSCAEYHHTEDYCILLKYRHLNISNECLYVARSLQIGHYYSKKMY